MTDYRRTFVAALLPLLWAGAAAAQASFDCSKASTAAEKAICADPALAAADVAMTKAYSALSKTLPPAQQTGLKADQRSWVTGRDGGCFDKKDDALTQCLLAATQSRTYFLAGEGDNGATGAPPLLPVYYLESKKGAYDITVTYPQFAKPAAAKFNAAAHDLAFGKNALSEYRQNGPNRFNGSSNSYQVSYEATYLDPKVASVTLQFAEYAGGAHPNNWRIGLLWDSTTDTAIALGDFLADPASGVQAISALCKSQAEKDDWGLFDNPDFDTVVKDTKSWAVDKEGVTIMFDPYSVAPYVAGPHDCRIGYADLKDVLKPGGVLPPK
jgi:uncharacterized protein YecT (DUF1311 family)